MEQNQYVEYLLHFGLTRQEALIYVELLVKGKQTGYEIAKVEEFCGNCIRRMQEEQEWMERNLPQKKAETEGYITIEGEQNILDKAKNLIAQAGERVYLSCTAGYLDAFRQALEELVKKKRKVVILTDAPYELKDAIFYQTEEKGQQIGLIVDSKSVLSGEYGKGSLNTCLYSGQKNFVTVFKNAMANEIKLIQLQKGGTVL